MSIVRELKFAERVTRSGRDLEDQDVAEFEFKAYRRRWSKKFSATTRAASTDFDDHETSGYPDSVRKYQDKTGCWKTPIISEIASNRSKRPWKLLRFWFRSAGAKLKKRFFNNL